MSISSRVLFHHVICLKERKNNVNSVPLQVEPLSHPGFLEFRLGPAQKSDREQTLESHLDPKKLLRFSNFVAICNTTQPL